MRITTTAGQARPRLLALAVAHGIALGIALPSHAADWGHVRAAPSAGGPAWQQVPCESGSGWQLCQPPLVMTLNASPASIIGNGSATSTVTATLRDALGNSVGAGVRVDWSATRGTLSSASTTTNASGQVSVTLRSAKELGGTTVRATAITDEGGSQTVYISFLDNWLTYDPVYGNWVNSGGLYGCSWSPSTSSYPLGQAFTQTGSNCKQDQVRSVQYRQISEVTGTVRNNGTGSESRTLTGLSSSRSATGSYVAPTAAPTSPPATTPPATTRPPTAAPTSPPAPACTNRHNSNTYAYSEYSTAGSAGERPRSRYFVIDGRKIKITENEYVKYGRVVGGYHYMQDKRYETVRPSGWTYIGYSGLCKTPR